MSLYISGVPLPKLGPVFLRIEPSGAVVEHDDNTGEDIIVGQAIDTSWHGRLVDADALIEHMEYEINHFEPENEFSRGLLGGYKAAVRTISEFTFPVIPASKGGA